MNNIDVRDALPGDMAVIEFGAYRPDGSKYTLRMSGELQALNADDRDKTLVLGIYVVRDRRGWRSYGVNILSITRSHEPLPTEPQSTILVYEFLWAHGPERLPVLVTLKGNGLWCTSTGGYCHPAEILKWQHATITPEGLVYNNDMP